ncbi:Transcription termination factor MTERF2, chloroplastic [Trichoplax sp. H2]|nr:Transcription termination factor MTERF2, chloroplastic [Trichoplax sp. H2]|eukprot:RDD38921.1 Transcription termination factor MTERF2, chloroplastic [Trichoplax sp. H2]
MTIGRSLRHHQCNYVWLAKRSHFFKKLKKITPTTQYLYSLGADVEKLLLQNAPITKKNVDIVQDHVAFLQNLGISEDSLSIVITKGHRFILAARPELQQRIEFFTDLGMTKDDVVGMIVTFPKLMTMHTEREILPRIDYLRSIISTDKAIATIIQSNPTSLNYSPLKLQERIDIFRNGFLKFDVQDIEKIIIDCPRLLSIKSSSSTRSLLWLKNNYFSQDQIQQIILKYPCFVTLDLAKIDAIWKWMNKTGLIFTNKKNDNPHRKQSRSLIQQLQEKLKSPYEVRDIVEYPNVFGEPLEKLRNRIRYVTSLQILDEKLIPFEDLVKFDDRAFAETIAESNYKSYQRFVASQSVHPW